MTKISTRCLLFVGLAITLALTMANLAAAQGKAIQTEFGGTEVHVKWLAQPAPTILPSGNTKIEGWEHLWYDDAEDDRLDGYATVFIDAMLDPTGGLIHAGGKFNLREKLDDYELDDFLNGTFDPDQVLLGDILFEGTWNVTPSGGAGVALNSEGLKAFYTIDATESPDVNMLSIRLLDPNNALHSVPEPSALATLTSALLGIFAWRRR